MKNKKYAGWALSVIAIACNDNDVPCAFKIDEIRCVINHDGHYPEVFERGDSPADAWQGAVDALAGSQ